jgi:hypothetical protein
MLGAVSAPIGTEDLTPTLLRLCCAAVPRTVQGLDYSGCMAGGKDPTDGAAITIFPAPFGQWTRALGGREHRAIRTARYTYAADLNGPWLLFENVHDPYQLENLAGKPEFAALQARLDAWLRRKLMSRHDAFEPADAYVRRWGYTVDADGTVTYDP